MRGGWGALCALTWAFAHLPRVFSESCSLLDLSCYACKYLDIGSNCKGESYTYSYTYTTQAKAKELICLSQWPSETENYYGPTFGDHGNQLDARDNLGNTTIIVTIDSDGHTTSISHVSDDHGLEDPVRLSPREVAQCCRVTWECWYFWGTLGQVAHGVNLTKSDCCVRDFLRPKPDCPDPPDLEIAMLMSYKEPPACSRLEDS